MLACLSSWCKLSNHVVRPHSFSKLPATVAISFDDSDCSGIALSIAISALVRAGCRRVMLVSSCSGKCRCCSWTERILEEGAKVDSKCIGADLPKFVVIEYRARGVICKVDGIQIELSQIPCQKSLSSRISMSLINGDWPPDTDRFLFRSVVLESLTESKLAEDCNLRRHLPSPAVLPSDTDIDLLISFRSTYFGFAARQLDVCPALIDQSEIQSVFSNQAHVPTHCCFCGSHCSFFPALTRMDFNSISTCVYQSLSRFGCCEQRFGR